jgi:hypothetical protein
LKDIADAQRVTVPFVSRIVRLAFLSLAILEQLLVQRRPCTISLDRRSAAALAPWAEQLGMVFEE